MSLYQNPPNPALLGSIEPHAALLRQPPAGQLLYKVMSVENCIGSIERGYLSGQSLPRMPRKVNWRRC